MNDDDAAPDLHSLKAEHRKLDERIELLRMSGAADQLELARLKKRKLLLKDQIELLHDRAVPDIIA
jgi:hypothetical protein